jgi:lipopolysaccharide/colanic/teichoic acid biosynthesis glycosyltransferase
MGSLAGLAVCWPFLLGVALLVRASSPGPALYRGERAGRHGRPFRIFKFRTMVVDAETRGGTTTAATDPRVTNLGRFLRHYKLDELPQLLNVLRGEMSFVGPRPEVYEYVDEYSPSERRILDVRPGITDLASVEYVDLTERVGSTDPDATYRKTILAHKNRLRLEYVDRRSLLLDARILARTAHALLRRLIGEGA